MEALRQKNEKPMDAINSSKLPSKMNMRRLFAKKNEANHMGFGILKFLWNEKVFYNVSASLTIEIMDRFFIFQSSE